MGSRRNFLEGIVAATMVGVPSVAEAKQYTIPALALYTEKGATTSLHVQILKPTVLSVWAWYCGPCIRDIPVLNQLTDRMNIVGLYLMDTSKFSENSRQLRRWQELRPTEFPNFLVRPKEANRLREWYGEQTGVASLQLPSFIGINGPYGRPRILSGELDESNVARLESMYRSL